MESCIYEGIVHHERLTPVNHRFQYRMFMVYLDLAETSALLRDRLLAQQRFSSASFVRADHVGDAGQPLDQVIRELVAAETGLTATGPIRLLTHLRYFGYYFSPLSLYYCYERDGSTLHAVVAEVQNTPWMERHCYVLWSGNRDPRDAARHRHRKDFHVSPFMAMEMEYAWRLTAPGEILAATISNEVDGQAIFHAAMRFRRRPLTHANLRVMQWRYPVITAQISLAIHLQAFQLWRKKCPFYSHPNHRLEPSSDPLPVGSAPGVATN